MTVKYSLTAEDAEKVNAATQFARDRGDDPEKVTGAVEGDSYPSLVLPNKERWVFTGAGGWLLVGDGSDDDDESDTPPSA